VKVLNDISNIPANGSVFVDSNIITYFLLKHRDFEKVKAIKVWRP
jgi:hypothetical protein